MFPAIENQQLPVRDLQASLFPTTSSAGKLFYFQPNHQVISEIVDRDPDAKDKGKVKGSMYQALGHKLTASQQSLHPEARVPDTQLRSYKSCSTLSHFTVQSLYSIVQQGSLTFSPQPVQANNEFFQQRF